MEVGEREIIHNLFEEKGEPKRYRLWAKLAVVTKDSMTANESAQTLAVVFPVRAKATELGQHSQHGARDGRNGRHASDCSGHKSVSS